MRVTLAPRQIQWLQGQSKKTISLFLGAASNHPDEIFFARGLEIGSIEFQNGSCGSKDTKIMPILTG